MNRAEYKQGAKKMEKASKYIKLITEMYVLSDKIKEKLNNNQELIEKSLENYYWDDIKYAIEKYYTYKNDKTYPKLCHITAILNATGKEIKKEEPVPEIEPPRTNIRQIQDVFMEVCTKLHQDGIFWCEYLEKIKNIPFGNKNYINSKTGIMESKRWEWDKAISNLIMNFPQEYNKFKHLTTTEKYALAYKLGCYGIKQ